MKPSKFALVDFIFVDRHVIDGQSSNGPSITLVVKNPTISIRIG
jgi:hypothetical protein